MLVFLHSKAKQRWVPLSPVVVSGFVGPEMGNTIPQAVISSPDMSQLWGQMDYPDLQNDKKFREIKKQINAIREGEKEPENDPERILHWPVKADGGYYVGSFQGLEENRLILKKESGQTIRVPLDRLAPTAVEFAKQRAGVETDQENVATEKKEPEFEAWTGSNGKVIQAKFVKLEADKITLELESGKTATLPLSRLADSSQERAKELGGE